MAKVGTFLKLPNFLKQKIYKKLEMPTPLKFYPHHKLFLSAKQEEHH